MTDIHEQPTRNARRHCLALQASAEQHLEPKSKAPAPVITHETDLNESNATGGTAGGKSDPPGAASAIQPDPAHALVLQFGIPSLDQLVGRRDTLNEDGDEAASEECPFGLAIDVIRARKGSDWRYASASFCMVGPDGAGKSVLAMHMASRYGAQTFRDGDQNPPAVLYASTDLSYPKAAAVWENFGLEFPHEREIQLGYEPTTSLFSGPIPIEPYRPFLNRRSIGDQAELSPLIDYISPTDGILPQVVAFIDLESNTAGDDWGFLTRLIEAIDQPAASSPLHMLIIDAVEGLQMMNGELDTFGELRSRRSRIAQLMRAASGKCHLVFVVEEPKSDERFPEQFVTDGVIRLRSTTAPNGYVHRTLEVEKARAQSHVRGRHNFTIRGGKGSTTGKQVNPDDRPYSLRITASNGEVRVRPLSHVLVFPSLDYFNRKQMERRAEDLHPRPGLGNLGFGITYLDNMLAQDRADPQGPAGLPYHSVTGIIGSSKTYKSQLARAFLSQSFRTLKELLALEFDELMLAQQASAFIAALDTRKEAEYEAWRVEAQKMLRENFRPWARGFAMRSYSEYRRRSSDMQISNLVRCELWHDFDRLRRWARVDPGVAVMITTSDIHSHQLVYDMYEWLHDKAMPDRTQLDEDLDSTDPDVRLAALRDVSAIGFAESRTICRRLEVHSMTPAVMFHIVKSAVEEAQNILLGSDSALGTTLEQAGSPGRQLSDREFDRCANIRVVIDNWSTIVGTYPALREDTQFLPYLLFYLRRQGVTTVILETNPADTLSASIAESHLAHLVDHTLLTRNVRFFGRRLAAISSLTSFSPGQRSFTREIVQSKRALENSLDTVYVDPHLELYSNMSTGEPQPIPLRVRLFTESEKGSQYAERANVLLTDIFPAVNKLGRDIVSYTKMPFEENGELRYERLREICNLHEGTLDHTVVWQVDEFWAMDPAAKGLARQADYLSAVTNGENVDENRIADPFGLFQPTAVAADQTMRTRADSFHLENLGYKGFAPDTSTVDAGNPSSRKARSSHGSTPSVRPSEPDRVPYTWDLGFLLCRANAWERASERKFVVGNNARRSYTVREVWQEAVRGRVGRKYPDSLASDGRISEPWSWRVFLEACAVVARANARNTNELVPPFDLALQTPESVTCLLLEMWISEIYRLEHNLAVAAVKPTFKDNDNRYVIDRLTSGRTLAAGPFGLTWLTQKYSLELYKCLMLLFESLGPVSPVDSDRVFSFKIRDANPQAIAVRHWYKTAAKVAENHDSADPIVPIRLPGHFSVRGDWFLALAEGSRSMRLGERAIDLLTSRRANIQRLLDGIGLPTRKLLDEPGYDQMRTCLYTDDPAYFTDPVGLQMDNKTKNMYPASRRRNLLYHELCFDVGVPQDAPEAMPFHWLWRSRIRDYDRHARIMHRWLSRMLLELGDLKRSRGPDWFTGFRTYDTMDNTAGRLAVAQWNSYLHFKDRLALLQIELEAASQTNGTVQMADIRDDYAVWRRAVGLP